MSWKGDGLLIAWVLDSYEALLKSVLDDSLAEREEGSRMGSLVV